MNRTDGSLKLLSDHLTVGAMLRPDHTALIYQGARISYQEFYEKVENLACYLLEIGIEKGDRISYILTPRPEFFYLYMAASRIGAIIVGMSTRHTIHEMEYVINNSGASYIFSLDTMYDIDYQARITDLYTKCPTLQGAVIVGEKANLANSLTINDILNKDFTYIKPQLEAREESLSTHDGLIIVYTSGSTGTPKGALMSHQNIIHMSMIEIAQCGADYQDIWLNHLPVNHVSGATEIGATAIIANSTMVLAAFNPADALDLIQKEKITILGQVPTMFAMEFALENYDSYDLSSLKTVVISGAPATMEILRKIVSTMTKNCYNCLGLTEVSGLITYTLPGASLETLNETVGICAPEFEMKLVDNDRNIVPTGDIGEIAYRGTSVIKEYYELPEATAAAFDDEGWFYSGDLGVIDEDGMLRLVGRSKEIYITGGFNVYPVEIEEQIMRYPKVLMTACIAIPNSILGEIGRAYVVPNPGETIDIEALSRYLAEYLADYKLPREYIVRDMLPLTLLGKIDKKALRQELEAELKEK
ncbi:MAG TPA: class I adenylate-forming enzyme family protein [Syntrophomonadaceae bacterium]|nr:class I adenylate-forming enzyme family protein [Syntrophomonadaceae bacterium]